MERTKEIQNSTIISAITLSSSLSTSLGPRGSDKIIIKDKKTLITNDGATILKTLSYNHPINKILSDLSQSQDKNCGDGTTSVVVLTGSILKRCKYLLDKNVHPTLIVKTIEKIKNSCLEYIDSVKIHISNEYLNKERFKMYVNEPVKDVKSETGENSDLFIYRDSLLKSVVTSLSSKIVSSSSIEYAPVAVDSVLHVQGNIENIKIVKKIGGAVEDIKFTNSFVLNSNLKNNKTDGILNKKLKMALIQFCISPPKTNIDSKILINDHLLMEKIIKDEREYLLNICKKIKKSGVDLIIIQKSILRDSLNELALHFLSKLNILVIDDVERDEISALSKRLNLKTSVDPDFIQIKEVVLEEKEEHGNKITEIIHKDTCSIVIRGSDNVIVDEAERSLNDALCVVKCLFEDAHLVPGGGAIEMGISNKLMEDSVKVRKEHDVTDYSYSYIFYEISKAFEDIPYFLARNAGLSSFEIINEMRNKIKEQPFIGINVRTNSLGCMVQENVVQPVKVSKSIVILALETAAMILKIDDILPAIK